MRRRSAFVVLLVLAVSAGTGVTGAARAAGVAVGGGAIGGQANAAATNEAVAMAQCRAIAEAEEIYHRSDYDGNGVLEYAQVLAGRAEDFKRMADKPLKIETPSADEYARIEKLIAALNADEFATREKSTNALIALGTKAYTLLQKTAETSTEGEVVQRCQRAVVKIAEANASASRIKLKYRFGLLGSNGNAELALIDRRTAQAECAAGCNPARSTPKRGYLYRILTQQGAAAPGGKRNYIVDGSMTRGYAVLAFPAGYGMLGKRCFMIDHTGTLYARDFQSAEAMEKFVKDCIEFNPTSEWKPVQ